MNNKAEKETNLEKAAKSSLFRISFLVALFAILMPLFSVQTSFSEMYKWRDENGQWHFSDQPPPESQEESWWDEKGTAIRTEMPPTQVLVKDPAAADRLEEPKPVGEGVLWKVEGGGLSPSYILGTIHSEDPRVLNFSPALESALKNKDVFIMEVVLDESAMAYTSAAMIFMDGRTLDKIVGNDLYAKTVRVAENYGIPEIALNRMKPWAVVSVLSTPKPQTGQFMDLELYRRAKEQNKQIVGLETAQEQIGLFDSMSMEDQVALLEDTLNHVEDLPGMFEQLIRTYLSGDLKKVADLVRTLVGATKNRDLTEKTLKRFNDDRNYRMVDRMLPYIVAGDAFVAVGALHLPGEKGILGLLTEKGFTVSPVQ